MKIDDIISEWKIDSKIDDLNIDQESTKVAKIHAKYMEWLSNERSILRALDLQRRSKYKALREYYLGTATQEQLQELKRTPYLQRILKNEVVGYIESDDILLTLDAKISSQQEKVDVLTEIIKAINNRNFLLKNAIDWRRLTLGG